MNTTVTGAALGVVLLAAAGAAPQDPARSRAEFTEAAATIVNRCAGLRTGEKVLIHGATRDQALLESLAVETRKLGAHPLIVLGSDDLTRRMITDIPEALDTQEPKLALELAEMIDARITVEISEAPDLLKDVDPARLARQTATLEPVWRRMLDRDVVQVHIGNGLYPTVNRARQFGMAYPLLASIFSNGLSPDYDQLQATGEAIREKLAAGRTVRITAGNGTDLTVEITDRPVFVSDGIISSEDRRIGGPACQVWLPAGEVFTTAVPGTANGTFVVDTFFFQGRLVENLELVFTDGRLTDLSARGDARALKKHYEAAGEGRDLFAFVDIGINPNVMVPLGSRFVSWMAAGTITVGVGNNTWAGGDNATPFEIAAHLLGGSLAVDEEVIVKEGHVTVP